MVEGELKEEVSEANLDGNELVVDKTNVECDDNEQVLDKNNEENTNDEADIDIATHLSLEESFNIWDTPRYPGPHKTAP